MTPVACMSILHCRQNKIVLIRNIKFASGMAVLLIWNLIKNRSN